MQVVILCGGLGTRLREETEFRPKPMVQIGSRPLLWHIMKRFAHFGHTEFILCLGYRGDLIKEYFYHYELLNNDFTTEIGANKFTVHNNHHEDGWKVTLADTGLRTLKGGRIKRIEKYITGESFMLTYGDGVCDIDLRTLQDFHVSHGKTVTVTGVTLSSQFGMMKVDGPKVISFREKPQASNNLINGGYMVVNRGIFSYLTDEESCDFEIGPMEKLAFDGELMVYKHHGNWASMDNLRDVDYLNKLWDNNKAFWKIW
jgi:glucose-1-phosphate cytidylyltransferase